MKQAWEAAEPGRAAKVLRSQYFIVARDGMSRNAPNSAFSRSLESDCESDFLICKFFLFFFPQAHQSRQKFLNAHIVKLEKDANEEENGDEEQQEEKDTSSSEIRE